MTQFVARSIGDGKTLDRARYVQAFGRRSTGTTATSSVGSRGRGWSRTTVPSSRSASWGSSPTTS